MARIGEGASIGEGARIGAKDEAGIPIYAAPFPDAPRNYYVTITPRNMAIGCQVHTLAEWAAFDDTAIAAMDGKAALTYWRKYKGALFALAATQGWGAAPANAEAAA